MSYNKELGKWGEDIACRFLESHDFKILERNYFTPYGEIDIVSGYDDVLVFVEVKTRTSTGFGAPEEAITKTKREHLINAALLFMEKHPEFDLWEFDLITVEGSLNSINPRISRLRNAIVE